MVARWRGWHGGDLPRHHLATPATIQTFQTLDTVMDGPPPGGAHLSKMFSRPFDTQPPPIFCGAGTRVHPPQLMRQTATQNLQDFTTQLDPSVRSPVRRKRLRRDKKNENLLAPPLTLIAPKALSIDW